ncbi:MAG: xanthine dehydrogenase accessory protein XdhC [Planktomarina sp.]|nr:xanthine dehydrogenase accessory protein XdhC [Planktomarina sp.]
MSFDLLQLNTAIAQHGGVHRVVIAAIKGSSPREVGASMLLWPGGQSGTIGGGALEYQASQSPKSGLRSYPLGPELGQCCGGYVTLVTEYFNEPIEATDLFVRQIERDLPLPLPMARLQQAIRNGSGMAAVLCSGGWLAEPIEQSRTPLWVWGAGHVGRAVVPIAAQMQDFDVTWIDTSPDRFPKDPAQNVNIVPAAEPVHLMAHASTAAQHLIFTYSHALDLAICHAALTKGFTFCGLIGSASKWARFRGRLAALGHNPSEILKITCPIGDPNLGKEPISIAISVTQALLLRNNSVTTKRNAHP